MQEHVQALEVGRIPRSLVVLLEHDLVDRAKPGDDVVVVGRLMRRWRPVQKDLRCQVIEQHLVGTCRHEDLLQSLKINLPKVLSRKKSSSV